MTILEKRGGQLLRSGILVTLVVHFPLTDGKLGDRLSPARAISTRSTIDAEALAARGLSAIGRRVTDKSQHLTFLDAARHIPDADRKLRIAVLRSVAHQTLEPTERFNNVLEVVRNMRPVLAVFLETRRGQIYNSSLTPLGKVIGSPLYEIPIAWNIPGVPDFIDCVMLSAAFDPVLDYFETMTPETRVGSWQDLLNDLTYLLQKGHPIEAVVDAKLRRHFPPSFLGDEVYSSLKKDLNYLLTGFGQVSPPDEYPLEGVALIEKLFGLIYAKIHHGKLLILDTIAREFRELDNQSILDPDSHTELVERAFKILRLGSLLRILPAAPPPQRLPPSSFLARSEPAKQLIGDVQDQLRGIGGLEALQNRGAREVAQSLGWKIVEDKAWETLSGSPFYVVSESDWVQIQKARAHKRAMTIERIEKKLAIAKEASFGRALPDMGLFMRHPGFQGPGIYVSGPFLDHPKIDAAEKTEVMMHALLKSASQRLGLKDPEFQWETGMDHVAGFEAGLHLLNQISPEAYQRWRDTIRSAHKRLAQKVAALDQIPAQEQTRETHSLQNALKKVMDALTSLLEPGSRLKSPPSPNIIQAT